MYDDGPFNGLVDDGKIASVLDTLAENAELIEVGRMAIEDTLIGWRDDRISEFGRGNGFVIRESDGTNSSIIRFGPETGLKIALKAIAEHLEKNTTNESS